MNQKSLEHIALYSLVLVGTLVVGVLARQFVLSKGVDDFTVSATTHRSFSIAFLCFSNGEKSNDTVSVPEAPTIKDSNQATPDVIESAPTAEETISGPSEYEVMRTNSIAKKNRAIQTKLEKVISYRRYLAKDNARKGGFTT